jgi:hypothetical protein
MNVLDTPHQEHTWLEVAGVLSPPYRQLSDLSRAQLAHLFVNREMLLRQADLRLALAQKHAQELEDGALAALETGSEALAASRRPAKWKGQLMALINILAGFLTGLMF